MKDFRFHRWIKQLAAIFLASGLLLVSLQAIAGKHQTLILKSSSNSFYDTTIEHLIDRVESLSSYSIRTLSEVQKDRALLDNINLIITLGDEAARFSIENAVATPSIHSYLTEFQYRQLPKPQGHSFIQLEQPLHRYLSFSKQLLDLKSIAIINSSQSEKISAETTWHFNNSLRIQIEHRVMKEGDNPLPLVRELLQRNDALLSLPDPEVYNRQSLKGILLTSYRLNKPVISYSPAHVKSGALAAIYSSPENIGHQLGNLINQMDLNSKFQPSRRFYASDFQISINRRVARSLGLKLADESEILIKLKDDESVGNSQ